MSDKISGGFAITGEKYKILDNGKIEI